MSDQAEIPLFPVASWTVGPILAFNAVTMKFDFLTNLMQPVGEATTGRHYVFTEAQARELVEKLQSALRVLESAAPSAPPGPRH
jgi:hypothetical protein